MKKILTTFTLSVAAFMGVMALAGETADSLTASDAFVRMPAQTLDILTMSMRLDLLDYYRADSIYRVPNVMEGLSYLHRPLTRDYVKVQITPVTTLTLRMMPWKKKRLVVSVYTIGDSLQAADSDIRFYDTSMRELDRDRFIKIASTEDFFNFEGVDRGKRRELLAMIPFPTVEYTLDPESSELHARLTSDEFLSKETVEKITPYLRRDRIYRWTGDKFEIQK